ncbi:MAG: LptE family protein [Candidatus Korobacteraceae bacterium]
MAKAMPLQRTGTASHIRTRQQAQMWAAFNNLFGLAALVLLFAAFGCGYHVAGKASRLPESVHTIAVPTFENKTQTYRIETRLTEAVVREFNTRTKYRIVSKPDGADATLRGTVLSTQIEPLTYDPRTGRASSGVVTIRASVSLTDDKGNVLYRNQNYMFRDVYQISVQVSSFFEEEDPAIGRLSADFARTLVGNVLEAF